MPNIRLEECAMMSIKWCKLLFGYGQSHTHTHPSPTNNDHKHATAAQFSLMLQVYLSTIAMYIRQTCYNNNNHNCWTIAWHNIARAHSSIVPCMSISCDDVDDNGVWMGWYKVIWKTRCLVGHHLTAVYVLCSPLLDLILPMPLITMIITIIIKMHVYI